MPYTKKKKDDNKNKGNKKGKGPKKMKVKSTKKKN